MSDLSERERWLVDFGFIEGVNERGTNGRPEPDAYRHAAKHAPAALRWTTELPTVPGTYWVGRGARKWTVHLGREDLGPGLYPGDEDYKFCGPLDEPSE